MKLNLTLLGRHEAYLHLYNILTSLPIAKDYADKYLKLEREHAAALISVWNRFYKEALVEIFSNIPSQISAEVLEIVTDGLEKHLGYGLGRSAEVNDLFLRYIGKTYHEAKKEFVPEAVLSLPDKRAIDILTKYNCFWLGEHYGKHIGPKIAAITQKAITDGLGRKELSGNLRSALGGDVGGYKYWDVVASASLVRARSFGTVSGMEEAGITEYQVMAMGDERTCPICGDMDGRVFSVMETREVIDRVLDIKDPEKFKEAMPWQTESPHGKSNGELVDKGMSIPPYHARCRCTLVMVGNHVFSDSSAKTVEQKPEAVEATVQEKPETPVKVKVKKPSVRELAEAKYTELKTKTDKFQTEYDSLSKQIKALTTKGESSMTLRTERQKVKDELDKFVKELRKLKLDCAEKKVIFASKLAEKLPKKDIEEVIKLVKKAPAIVRRVWNLYEDKMKVIDAHSQKSCFKNSEKGIYFDIDKTSISTADNKPYRTLFHELGHLIDCASQTYTNATSIKFDGGKFRETLEKEATQAIEKTRKNLEQKTKKKVSDKKVYTALSNELKDIPKYNRFEVSDIFHGATNTKINAEIGHFNNGYWNKTTIPLEAFAHFMSASVMNPEAMAELDKYFPKSHNLFKKMLKEIVEAGD